jgi:hypothetical protein
LSKKAHECETALAKLIRIRSLMYETDIWSMQETIEEQKSQIEELRVKLSFFQEHKKSEIKPVTKIETVKPLAELSENGLFIPMNDKQKDFLTELYIKSECITFNITQEDIDEWDSKNEDNDDNNDDEFNTRPEIHDERIEIYHREKQEPGYLLKRLTESLVSTFIFSSICELNDESKKHNSTQRYYYLREEYEKLATKNK